VAKEDYSPCGEARVHGVCDAGDWCKAGVCTDDHYEPVTTSCRPSEGCCDKVDYCPGDSHDCTADAKFGPETTCRDCPDCNALKPLNPAEVCDGVSNACPADIILADTLCLKAGQTAPAGSVSVTAAPVSATDYEFCVDISVEGWTLTGTDPIKVEISTEGAPGSAPGQYSYKYPNAGIVLTTTGTYKLCKTIQADICVDGFALYFAIHLDVKLADGTTETAWALDCAGTDLDGFRFTNKKKNAFQGWGKYFKWDPCCPYDSCDKCDHVETPPTGSPTPAPVTTGSPTPAPVTSGWNCFGTGGNEFTTATIDDCSEGVVCAANPTVTRRRDLLGLFL
jgi:hypothetical protein